MAKAPAKVDRIRLSKNQKIRVSQIIRIENRISVCREYIKLWSHLFRFFTIFERDKKFSPEEEKSFFQTTTALSRKQFLFCELTGDSFQGRDKIVEILTMCESLGNLSHLDEATLSKLELDTHALLLEMNVTLGSLMRQMPGTLSLNEIIKKAEEVAKADREAALNGTAETKQKKPRKVKEKKPKKEKKKKAED